MIDHGPRGYWAFDKAVLAQVIPTKCILDGELVVWNKLRKCFVPFGAYRDAPSLSKASRPARALF